MAGCQVDEDEGFRCFGSYDDCELQFQGNLLKQYLMMSMPRTQKLIIPTSHPMVMPTTAPYVTYGISLMQGITLTLNPLSLIGILNLFQYYINYYISQKQQLQSINIDHRFVNYYSSYCKLYHMIDQVLAFIHSNQFWHWHGFVLSGLWVIVSALAILSKRFSTTIHLTLFAIVDFTTIFFAGSALYRVSAGFANFNDWKTLKKGHIIGGVVFLVIMILQHFGGVIAYYTGKPNPLHRKFGRYVAMLGRIIAIFGWLLGGNQQNAIIVGVASAVILVISAVLPSPSKPGNRSQTSSSERSKSPRAKRQ